MGGHNEQRCVTCLARVQKARFPLFWIFMIYFCLMKGKASAWRGDSECLEASSLTCLAPLPARAGGWVLPGPLMGVLTYSFSMCPGFLPAWQPCLVVGVPRGRGPCKPGGICVLFYVITSATCSQWSSSEAHCASRGGYTISVSQPKKYQTL